MIDHVEFLYAEATKGRRITFFCAPKIVRGLELVVPQHVATPEAIANTYEIAVKEYSAQGINPMSRWDLHWVKELDDEGFIDGLIKQATSRRNSMVR